MTAEKYRETFEYPRCVTNVTTHRGVSNRVKPRHARATGAPRVRNALSTSATRRLQPGRRPISTRRAKSLE